jgi:hypothetical protein
MTEPGNSGFDVECVINYLVRYDRILDFLSVLYLQNIYMFKIFITTKPYTKFQLDISNNVEINCGNYLCVIFQVQKRGITSLKYDETRQNMNLKCGPSIQSHTQNFSSEYLFV